jgi:transposase-like protein
MPSRESFFAALGSLPAAVALLTALRWPDGITCPHCGRAAVGGHGRYDRCRALPRYRCKACHRTFMLTTGSPLARSRLSLPDWVVIAWLIVLGLSAGCAGRETERSYDRVYALMWRLIEAAIGREAERRLSGTVEVDEIYVSCGHKAEPESAPNPVQPLSAPTGARPGPAAGSRAGPRRPGSSRGLRAGSARRAAGDRSGGQYRPGDAAGAV